MTYINEAEAFAPYADAPLVPGHRAPVPLADSPTESPLLSLIKQIAPIAILGFVLYLIYREYKSGGFRSLRRNKRNKKRWKGSVVQTLMFPRDRYSAQEAKTWAVKHGYRSAKVDDTDRYYRIRQREPSSMGEKRTITLGRGIKAVIGGRKK